MNPDLPDHVVTFIADSLTARDNDLAPPEAEHLSSDELSQANLVLGEISDPVEQSPESPPLEEDAIAISLGMVEPPPPVVVDAAAVAAALDGHDRGQIVRALTDYGHTCDQAWLDGLASSEVTEVSPLVLRTLAVLVGVEAADLALQAIHVIKATDKDLIEPHLQPPWSTEIDDDAVCVASDDHRIGVLIAHVAEAAQLSSLNVRRVAWDHLSSRWLHHSACLVISPVDGWVGVVVDAIDCHPHHHAPSGALTFGPQLDPQPIGQCLDLYAARFEVLWKPPQSLQSASLENELIVPEALEDIGTVLIGSYAEPKKTAFAEVAADLDALPIAHWMRALNITDESDATEVEAILAQIVGGP